MRKSTLFCLSVLLIIGILSADMLQADGHRRAGRHLGYDNRYRTVNDQREDKGSETVGGMAAWLLAAANLAVILSLLIKWTGKLTAVNDGTKKKIAEIQPFSKEAAHAAALLGQSARTGHRPIALVDIMLSIYVAS